MDSNTPTQPQPDNTPQADENAMKVAVWLAGSDAFLKHWKARLRQGLGNPSVDPIDPIEMKGETAQGQVWDMPSMTAVTGANNWLLQEQNASRGQPNAPVGLVAMLAWRVNPQPEHSNHLPYAWGNGPLGDAPTSISHSDATRWIRRLEEDGHGPSGIMEHLFIEMSAKPRFNQPWREAILKQNLDARLTDPPPKSRPPRF